MSRTHLEYAVAQLSLGATETVSLLDFDIPEQQVIALDPAYEFDPEGSYCPLSDIPRGISCVGVFSTGGHAYIVGDSGDRLFMFRLTRKGELTFPPLRIEY